MILGGAISEGRNLILEKCRESVAPTCTTDLSFSGQRSFVPRGQVTWTVTVLSALQPATLELTVKVLRPADPNLDSSW